MVSEGGSRPLESPKYSSPYSRHGCCCQSAAAHLGLPQAERLAQWVMKSQEIRRTAVPELERPHVDGKSQRSQPADSIFRSEEYTFASSHLLRHCRRNFFGIRGCSGFERSGTENGNRAAVLCDPGTIMRFPWSGAVMSERKYPIFNCRSGICGRKRPSPPSYPSRCQPGWRSLGSTSQNASDAWECGCLLRNSWIYGKIGGESRRSRNNGPCLSRYLTRTFSPSILFCSRPDNSSRE